MVNHLSTIGFPLRSKDDFISLAQDVAGAGKAIQTKAGNYYHCAMECGAELWVQINSESEFVGMNPHFRGESRVKVGLTAQVVGKETLEMDGAFHGWAEPGKNPEEGSYPFLFDTPDFHTHGGIGLPTTRAVQVAAFAHEFNAFESKEAYDRAGVEGEFQMASQSFIPAGLFHPGGEERNPPEALAIFAGHILKAEEKVNEMTGESFYWVLVDSYGGTYDVVVDSSMIDKTPVVGGVVTGSFWLSGRILT
jgi:hypothetical protein